MARGSSISSPSFESAGLPTGADGKGRSCWICLGYLLAEDRSHVIVLHDADIVTYSRELLARLAYPVVSPQIDYDFCKGYYARVTDRLHGRVTRLLMFPLLRALEIVVGNHPYIRYLSSFRYPLAGEFALNVDLARVVRIPSDWGLEVGVLSEVYRNRSDPPHLPVGDPRRLRAQAPGALGRRPRRGAPPDGDRRRQPPPSDPLPDGDRPRPGAASHAAGGLPADGGGSRRDLLRRRRHRRAPLRPARGGGDGRGLPRGDPDASERFLADPIGPPDLPNWIRVLAARPDVFPELVDVVRADGGVLHE